MSELAGINQEDKCLIKFEDYHHGQLLIQLWMTLTKIYDAELVGTNKINEPGTIIDTTKKAIIVATNDNESCCN